MYIYTHRFVYTCMRSDELQAMTRWDTSPTQITEVCHTQSYVPYIYMYILYIIYSHVCNIYTHEDSVCMNTYLHTRKCAYTCLGSCEWKNACIYMHVFLRDCTDLLKAMYVHKCVYIYMFIHVYMYATHITRCACMKYTTFKDS